MTKSPESQKLRVRIMAGIGGFLAALLSIGYTVYNIRNDDTVTIVTPGTVIRAGQWHVTVKAGGLAGVMPDGLRLTDGKKALIVDVTLENVTTESSNLYYDTLRLGNVANAPTPRFFLIRDKEVLGDLQPLMPEEIKVVWQLPVDQTLPKALQLLVLGKRFKPKDSLYAAPGWFDPKEIARVYVPLGETAP